VGYAGRHHGGGYGVLVALMLAGGLVQASDDWDWGAVEELDDAPVTRPEPRAVTPTPAAPAAPRPVENARPDFAAEPIPAHALFVGMPAFEVIPSERDPGMHPCSNCHQWVQGNPEPRKLQQPHDNFELEHGLHGKGKFWCFTCHDLKGSGGLKTLEGDPLDFDDAYILCSQCHADQARDWVYGAHGKRVANWQGDRQVYVCTACHYQHRPGFRPRAPKDGPAERVGLERPEHWVAKDRRPHPVEDHRAEWEIAGESDAGPDDADAAGEDHVSDQEQGLGEKS